MNVIGIDPGLEGGIAVLGLTRQWGARLPLIGKEVDVVTLLDWIARDADEVAMVVVEKLGVRPKQSAQSGATQGINWGLLVGALRAQGLPVRVVRPQDWKAKVLKGTKKDKDDAIAFARSAYPLVELVPGRCKVAQDGIADAVCLAEYGRQLHGGNGSTGETR